MPFFGGLANAVVLTASVLTAETIVILATFPLRISTVNGVPTVGAAGAAGAGAGADDAGSAGGCIASAEAAGAGTHENSEQQDARGDNEALLFVESALGRYRTCRLGGECKVLVNHRDAFRECVL